jgi:hypothetical protein
VEELSRQVQDLNEAVRGMMATGKPGAPRKRASAATGTKRKRKAPARKAAARKAG